MCVYVCVCVCVHACGTLLEMIHIPLLSPLIDSVEFVQVSENPICSRDPLLYECTTNGPAVVWIVNDNFYVFNSKEQINTKLEGDGFIFSLINITSSQYFANSTIESVLSKDNGTRITCSDGVDFIPKDVIVTGIIEIQIFLVDIAFCGLDS